MYLFPKNVVSNVTSTLETLKFLKIDNVWSASFLTSIARKIFCRCAKDLHWRKKMGEVSALRKNGQPSNDAVITSPNLLYRKSYMVMAILNLADMEGLNVTSIIVCVFIWFLDFCCTYKLTRTTLQEEIRNSSLPSIRWGRDFPCVSWNFQQVGFRIVLFNSNSSLIHKIQL